MANVTLKDIATIKDTLEKAKLEKASTQARLSELTKQKDELEKQVMGMGFDPSSIPAELEKISKEIDELVDQIKVILPGLNIK